jgi:hypothetical protein
MQKDDLFVGAIYTIQLVVVELALRKIISSRPTWEGFKTNKRVMQLLKGQ